MPLNLLKIYNSLLELDFLDDSEREASLAGIFRRDFIESQCYFRNHLVMPTPEDGKTTMEILFNHLTTQKAGNSLHRIFDMERAIRIHWIKYHIREKTPDNINIFSVKDKKATRTYIYDPKESYVIVLEPRQDHSYFLITAYYLKGRNKYKIEKKQKRQLYEIY